MIEIVYNLTTHACQRRKYEERKKAGICVECGNKAEPNRIRCKACAIKESKRSAKRRKLKKELGVRILGTQYKKGFRRKEYRCLDDS